MTLGFNREKDELNFAKASQLAFGVFKEVRVITNVLGVTSDTLLLLLPAGHTFVSPYI